MKNDMNAWPITDLKGEKVCRHNNLKYVVFCNFLYHTLQVTPIKSAGFRSSFNG